MHAREQKRLLGNEKAESDRDEEQETLPPSTIYEGDIQEFIVKNIGLLESGLQVIEQHKKIYEDNKVIGEIDILCKDTNGVYVVVELKRNKAGDKVAGQISRYLTWVDRNLAKGVTPRGIIVASVKDIKLEHAIGAIKYNIEIREFHDSPPTKENVKYCGSCRTPNPKSSEYCQSCGAKFWMQ